MNPEQEKHDVEFEAFLRQFRPHKPPALSAFPRAVTTGVLVAAAGVVLAVVVTSRFVSRVPGPDNEPSAGSIDVQLPSVAGTRQTSPTEKTVLQPETPSKREIPPSRETLARPGTIPQLSRSVSAGPAAAIGAPQASPRLPRPGPSAATGRAATSSGAASQRLRVGGDVKPPVRLVNVNPEYPLDAQAAGISGVVVLDIVIGEDGSVIEARVRRSIPELDQAAIDAVSQWVYEPTLLNGEPVEIETTVTINFTLR